MNRAHNKAQISIEFIVIMGILILSLASVLFFSQIMQGEANNLKGNFDKSEECLSIARKVSALYANGDGGQFRINTNYELQFTNQTLTVDDVSCDFNARLKKEVTITGKILIRNYVDEIFIENY